MERDILSRFGSLMVIAGSAVGLGNIWRFPYMVATNGGAAFILLYIFFVIVICLPVMVSELVIGRRSSRNAGKAMMVLSKGRPRLHRTSGIFGILYIAIPVMLLSYYCVIGGDTVFWFLRSLGVEATADKISGTLCTIVFLGLTAVVVSGGVKAGIERFSNIMMPLLFVLVIIIAVRSLTLPAAGTGYTAADGINFMFRPDFSKITAKTCLAALGQAFFSLSIGSGVLITYGSYINPKDNLLRTAGSIAFCDLLFAIIAGCAVIPAVFALEAAPQAVLACNTDSRLVFNTLPEVFAIMPMGGLIGALFFFSLIIAALTSSVSMMEVPVTWLTEESRLSRKTTVKLLFLLTGAAGILCTLKPAVLGAIDGLCANWLMPVAGIGAAFFAGWMMKKAYFYDELDSRGLNRMPQGWTVTVRTLIRYTAPVGVLAVFLTQILDLV